MLFPLVDKLKQTLDLQIVSVLKPVHLLSSYYQMPPSLKSDVAICLTKGPSLCDLKASAFQPINFFNTF